MNTDDAKVAPGESEWLNAEVKVLTIGEMVISVNTVGTEEDSVHFVSTSGKVILSVDEEVADDDSSSVKCSMDTDGDDGVINDVATVENKVVKMLSCVVTPSDVSTVAAEMDDVDSILVAYGLLDCSSVGGKLGTVET